MTAGIERLEGVWTIVPTPFRPDGALDTDSLPTLTRFIADRAVDGMTILGVLGEAGRLGDDERDQVIDGVLAAAGDLPVCVGVSHAGTDRAVAFARRAEAAGAHSVMLAPPALARPNDAAVLAHYRAVADAIAIPVVVQDHPASSGVTMTRGPARRPSPTPPRRVGSSSSRTNPAHPRSAASSRPVPTCASSAASAGSCCSRSCGAGRSGR